METFVTSKPTNRSAWISFRSPQDMLRFRPEASAQNDSPRAFGDQPKTSAAAMETFVTSKPTNRFA
jgi:hypothetical protein